MLDLPGESKINTFFVVLCKKTLQKLMATEPSEDHEEHKLHKHSTPKLSPERSTIGGTRPALASQIS